MRNENDRHDEKTAHRREEAMHRYYPGEEMYLRRKKSHAGRIFLRVLEILAVILSYLESSRIARFITAKLSMDLVVETTHRLGPQAGHSLSTFLAAIVAEPRLIALIVVILILLLELVALLIRRLGRHPREHRPPRPPQYP